ncbi:hypothetical protein AMECASPLE_017443, partial [Ameca splendens]
IRSGPDLQWKCSAPLRSPEVLGEACADHGVKPRDKCGRQTQTTLQFIQRTTQSPGRSFSTCGSGFTGQL